MREKIEEWEQEKKNGVLDFIIIVLSHSSGF